MIKLAINGFGRIGRNAFKIAFSRPDIDIVAINDLTDTKTLAHLLKHDTNYGTYNRRVESTDDAIVVDGKKVKVIAEKDPAALPWHNLGIDVVIESTGRFTNFDDASLHIRAGAKKVLVSAPVKGDERVSTVVIGVNEDALNAGDRVVSNASCTTNNITPIGAVIEENFGIEKAMMTTIHSYTASQVLQDAPAKDLREARSAAENIVPTTTGATIAAAQALPSLKDKFAGMSIRVPTPVVSISDFTFLLKKNTTAEEINECIKKASNTHRLKGVLSYTEEELVSSDFIGDPHSVIVDTKLTQVVGGNMAKIVAWYDNEWGYSNRLVELVEMVGKNRFDHK